jgi:hypothetical protein
VEAHDVPAFNVHKKRHARRSYIIQKMGQLIDILSFPQLTSSMEELPWQKGASCLNPSRCPGTKGYGLTMIRKIESKIFCPSAWSETAETAHVVHETTSL